MFYWLQSIQVGEASVHSVSIPIMPFPSWLLKILFWFSFKQWSDKYVSLTVHLFNVYILGILKQFFFEIFFRSFFKCEVLPYLQRTFSSQLTSASHRACHPHCVGLPRLFWHLPPPLLFIFQATITWFLRRIYCRRWIFSCFSVARHPDSPVPPSAWVIRDYIQQDALFSQGKEPEGSGGGRAFLQRRPGEAFLWPPRDWPWQLRRCLLCTAHHTLALHSKHKRKEKLWRWIKCTGAVGSVPNADRLPNAVRQWRGRCQLFWVYLITRSVVLSE